MAKRKTEISATGITAPDWAMVDCDIKPFTANNIKWDYKRLLQGALWYTHYEVSDKILMAEFLKYCNKKFNKDDVKLLKKLKDWEFNVIGKYTYIIAKGGKLDEELLARIDEFYEQFLKKATKINEAELIEEAEEASKPKAPVISIQQRMRDQVSDLCGNWDAMLDEIITGALTTRKFDPYVDIKKNDIEIKPAHAKIIKDIYQADYDESVLIAEWKDADIKEAYSNLDSPKVRKEFVAFFEKIFTACDTIINEGKATRKPRVKKAPSKQKLIEKIKYQESERTLGLASINPLSILDASALWVYNTKTRKLGVYVADAMQGPLSVKGTTITGFDTVKSTQKTVRKPEELLKGASKLARTKFDKLYAELTTTETKMNGRINEHTVLIKVF
jgi:hypothetical protein